MNNKTPSTGGPKFESSVPDLAQKGSKLLSFSFVSKSFYYLLGVQGQVTLPQIVYFIQLTA